MTCMIYVKSGHIQTIWFNEQINDLLMTNDTLSTLRPNPLLSAVVGMSCEDKLNAFKVFPSWEKKAYEEWSPRKLTSVKSRSPFLSDTVAYDLVVHQGSLRPSSCECSIKPCKNNLPSWITTYPKQNLHIELEWK